MKRDIPNRIILEFPNRTEILNGNNQLHSFNGQPAVIYNDGRDPEWYKNGKLILTAQSHNHAPSKTTQKHHKYVSNRESPIYNQAPMKYTMRDNKNRRSFRGNISNSTSCQQNIKGRMQNNVNLGQQNVHTKNQNNEQFNYPVADRFRYYQTRYPFSYRLQHNSNWTPSRCPYSFVLGMNGYAFEYVAPFNNFVSNGYYHINTRQNELHRSLSNQNSYPYGYIRQNGHSSMSNQNICPYGYATQTRNFGTSNENRYNYGYARETRCPYGYTRQTRCPYGYTRQTRNVGTSNENKYNHGYTRKSRHVGTSNKNRYPHGYTAQDRNVGTSNVNRCPYGYTRQDKHASRSEEKTFSNRNTK